MSAARNTRCRMLPALLIGFLLVASTGVLYGQTRHFDSISLDDTQYVFDNRHVKGGLTFQGSVWAFTAFHWANWHPVSWLSHMLDVQLFGMDAGGHHLTNVLFHGLNSLLLFHGLFRLTHAPWKSGMVAALFAIHPLNVESVAWIAERKNVLSTFFGLLSLGFYARYAREKQPAAYLTSLLAFALSLMSKPMLVTLPVGLLLVDAWPLGRYTPEEPFLRTIRRSLREKLPFLLLAVASAGVTLAAQGSQESIVSLGELPFTTRLANALVSCIAYVGQMIWPVDLVIYYPHTGRPPLWQPLCALMSLSLASAAAVRLRHRAPYLLFGWFWYLLTLTPVIGLIQVGSQARADRYTYVPLIGLFVGVAWGVPDLIGWLGGRRPRRSVERAALGTVAAAALVLLSVQTWHQIGHWQNGLTLLEHAVRLKPSSGWIHANLAFELAERGRTQEALTHYERALSLLPDYVVAHNNLGMLLGSQGAIDAAIPHFEAAIRASPRDADPLYNMGVALWQKGLTDQAVDYYRRALALAPEDPKIHNNLGFALMSTGRSREAVPHFEAALRIVPEDPTIQQNLQRARSE